MSARITRTGSTTVVAVSGEVDVATAGDLLDALAEATGGGPDRLVIDLLDVSFMDSSGLGVLVAIRQRHPEIPMTLVTGEGIVETVIDTVALHKMFEQARTISEVAP
jgi:anti-anti-sigma factor